MKKVLISGGVFLSLLFVHLLTTILFLFLEAESATKAMWMSALTLIAGIALIVAEMILARVQAEDALSDSDLGQIYVLKKTVSSVFCAAGLNTFVSILGIVINMPTLVVGVCALLYALVCIINVIALMLAQRSDKDEEAFDEELETEEAETPEEQQ